MRNGPYELITPPEEYPGKRYRGRYAYEHRVNWWKKTGLNPDDYPGSLIHHCDEEKRNNTGDNLEIHARSIHSKMHARPKVMMKWVCLNCSVGFERRKGKEQKFCSRRCIGLYNHQARKKLDSYPSG